jgi:hypothetical protein
VERIEVEPLGLPCPCLADVFIGGESLQDFGGESLQDFEAAGENIGSDEVGEVTSKLVMGVVIALQLQVPFQVGLVGFGLVAAAPDGPCDDESGLDPALG